MFIELERTFSEVLAIMKDAEKKIREEMPLIEEARRIIEESVKEGLWIRQTKLVTVQYIFEPKCEMLYEIARAINKMDMLKLTFNDYSVVFSVYVDRVIMQNRIVYFRINDIVISYIQIRA